MPWEHDCRARIVPDNPFAFPPSLEVDAGGRAMQGAIAEGSETPYMPMILIPAEN
jgi:hypothetical protein